MKKTFFAILVCEFIVLGLTGCGEKGDIVYGEFFEKVKVLAVKDSSGENVFESTDSVKSPSYLYFSLPEDKYLLFSALNYLSPYIANKFQISILAAKLIPLFLMIIIGLFASLIFGL